MVRAFLRDLPKLIALHGIPFQKKQGIIFWGHSGLGDAISSACIIEQLLVENRVVVIPSQERYLDFIISTYGSWEGVIVAKISNNPFWENLEILILRLRFRFAIKVVGHHLLQENWDEQDISLNEQFNLIAGIPPKQLVSARFRNTCQLISQVAPPMGKYIFVDHHPGTDREIPKTILKDALNRGLEIFRNDINVPLYRFLDVLDNAEEIHVVASAPLCFALTAGVKSQKKFYYRTKGKGLVSSISYPDWTDVDLR